MTNIFVFTHIKANYNTNLAGRRQFDVGVDANDFKPVCIEEIVAFFEGVL